MKNNNQLKKITIIFILVQCCFVNTKSQNSNYDLHNKYWFYKARFNNDFVSIGTDAGQSIPFNQRGFNDSYTYSSPSYTLKVGDASAQLGMYVGVLATEYRLLKDKGQDVSKVKHELFCALNAINRIDFNAEPIISNNPNSHNYNSPMGPNLNGFFVRDDIPEDFVKNHYQELNYYNNSQGQVNYPSLDANGDPIAITGDKGFTQLNTMGQFITKSSYSSFYDPQDINRPWNDVSSSNHGILNGI